MNMLLEQQDVSSFSSSSAPAWKRAELSAHVKFDSKVGFVYQGKNFPAKYLGLYRCSIGDSELANPDEVGAFVYVNIELKQNPATHPNEAIISPMLNENGTVEIKPYTTSSDFETYGVTCCTGFGNQRPEIYVEKCYTPLHCHFLKSQLFSPFSWKNKLLMNWLTEPCLQNTSSDCAKAFLYGAGDLVLCRGENIQYFGQYVTIFHPKMSKQLENDHKEAETIERKTTQLSGC